MNRYKLLLWLTTGLLLFSCDSSTPTAHKQEPVAFESSDECHVCGMVISRFSGPKGQAFETRNKQVRKFCSTRELIFWYLQPENQPNVSHIYVHDMAQTPWEQPDDGHLIAAKDAFYVIGSEMPGSMGPALASFSTIDSAKAFIRNHGGKLVSFKNLTLTLLSPPGPDYTFKKSGYLVLESHYLTRSAVFS